MIARSLGALLVSGLLACSDGALGTGFPRGCYVIDGDCIEYVGGGYTASAVEALCASGELVEVCPAGELGRCLIDSDNLDATVNYLYPQFWTARRAREKCVTRGGTWDGP